MFKQVQHLKVGNTILLNGRDFVNNHAVPNNNQERFNIEFNIRTISRTPQMRKLILFPLTYKNLFSQEEKRDGIIKLFHMNTLIKRSVSAPPTPPRSRR